MDSTAITIRPAESASDLDTIRRLFVAYATSLPIDLAYQGFEAELAGLPGAYAPPNGALLLAHNGEGEGLGCVALRPMPVDGRCEMKRLYVDPDARGLRLGERLAQAIIEAARDAGYRHLCLDTLPSMTRAQALYRRLGFEPIAPYYETPIEGTVFLGLRL